jgi:hypothetical protein
MSCTGNSERLIREDTNGSMVYIGRCHEMDDEHIVLLDLDEHEDGHDGYSKQEYIRRVVRVGVWKKRNRLVIPWARVGSVQRLGEIPPE